MDEAESEWCLDVLYTSEGNQERLLGRDDADCQCVCSVKKKEKKKVPNTSGREQWEHSTLGRGRVKGQAKEFKLYHENYAELTGL